MSSARLTVAAATGQSAGKAAAHEPAAQGRAARQRVWQSGWPRLLTVEQAGAYLGVSVWAVRELVNASLLPVTRVPRPNTASAIRSGERRPIGDTLRLVLLDRADLDAFVDGRCVKERRGYQTAPEAVRG